MKIRKRSQQGFTLIELMIVIIILGVLTTLISGNFLNSLKKGRDARRKGDLQNIQKALELYYEDVKAYPTTVTFGDQLCHPNLGCDTSTGKVYMQKIPVDPSSGYDYYYISPDGTDYKLYSCIENEHDQGQGVLQAGYNNNCGNCECKFGLSSSNVTP